MLAHGSVSASLHRMTRGVMWVCLLTACGSGDGLPMGDYELDSPAACDLGDATGASIGTLSLDGTIEFLLPTGSEVSDCQSVLRMYTGGQRCELCIVGERMVDTWNLGPRYPSGAVALPSCSMAASEAGRRLDGQDLVGTFRTGSDGAILFDFYFSGELRDTPGAAPETVTAACRVRAVPAP